MSQTCLLLKRLREAGFTQSDISQKTGIPQPRLSRWESGGVPKTADDALRLNDLALEICGATKGAPLSAESGVLHG